MMISVVNHVDIWSCTSWNLTILTFQLEIIPIFLWNHFLAKSNRWCLIICFCRSLISCSRCSPVGNHCNIHASISWRSISFFVSWNGFFESHDRIVNPSLSSALARPVIWALEISLETCWNRMTRSQAGTSRPFLATEVAMSKLHFPFWKLSITSSCATWVSVSGMASEHMWMDAICWSNRQTIDPLADWLGMPFRMDKKRSPWIFFHNWTCHPASLQLIWGVEFLLVGEALS